MQADASAEPGCCASRIARIRVAHKFKCCDHIIAARKRVHAGVHSAEVMADINASLRGGGLCDALHPANNTSPA